MEQSKIDRINFLARKSRNEGLSDSEIKEQRALRQEYIVSVRKNLTSQLDNTYIVRPDGTKTKVKKKDTD